MSTINAAAILKRIEQVLVDSLGNLRTVPAGRFQADSYEGISDDTEAIRAFVLPTVDAEIVAMRRHPQSPMTMHSLALMEIDVKASITRATDATAKVDAATRRTVKAAAVADADIVRQALSYPGNLATTSAGTSTGIVTGMLSYIDSSIQVRFGGDVGARVTSVHRLRGVVQITQATS